MSKIVESRFLQHRGRARGKLLPFYDLYILSDINDVSGIDVLKDTFHVTELRSHIALSDNIERSKEMRT